MLLPQTARLRKGRQVVRPNERHAGRYLQGGVHSDHRGCAKCGGGHRTRDVGCRLARPLPATVAAGTASTAGAVGAAGPVGTTGDAGATGTAGAAGAAGVTNDTGVADTTGDAGADNGTACDDAGDVAGATNDAGTDNHQVDEEPPNNELLQPGRTRARTTAYHQATATA